MPSLTRRFTATRCSRHTLLSLAGVVALGVGLGGGVAVGILATPVAAAGQGGTSVGAVAEPGVFPSDDALGVMLRYLVEDGATPGIVFGVVEEGGTRVLAHGTGGEGAAPLSGRSLFEIGSIGKTFTGTLLADMVARGEVALEDPVSRYLPDSVRVPSAGGREITLLDLATHRSGLPGLPEGFVPADLANPYADYDIGDLYAFLSEHELRREPGAEAEYSNLGFGLLGHVLARAAGTSYRDLLRERVLEPLGMESTRYVVEGEPGLTRGHRKGREVAHWSTTEAFDGAGGLYSTADDMLKYLAANVAAAGVGEPETGLQRAMREAQRVRRPFSEREGIGLGWRSEVGGGGTVVVHGGASAGYSARIAFDPDRSAGFVLLTNTGDFPDDLGLSFLRSGPAPIRPEVAVPARVLARYVGAYELAPGAHIWVRLEDDGTLTSQPGPNAVRNRLYADSDSTFFLKRLPVRLGFREDGSGAVDAMLLNPGPGVRVLPKVADTTPPPGRAAGPEVLDLPVTDADIARYEGRYLLGGAGRPIEALVYGQDGRLMTRIVGGTATRLLRQGEHVFVLEADPATRVEFTVDDGRVTGLTSHRAGGRPMTGRRVGGPPR